MCVATLQGLRPCVGTAQHELLHVVGQLGAQQLLLALEVGEPELQAHGGLVILFSSVASPRRISSRSLGGG